MKIIKCGDTKRYITLCYSNLGSKLMVSRQNKKVYYKGYDDKSASCWYESIYKMPSIIITGNTYINTKAMIVIELFKNYRVKNEEDKKIQNTLTQFGSTHYLLRDINKKTYIINNETGDKIDITDYIDNKSHMYIHTGSTKLLMYSNYSISVENNILYIHKITHSDSECNEEKALYSDWHSGVKISLVNIKNLLIDHQIGISSYNQVFGKTTFTEVFKTKI